MDKDSALKQYFGHTAFRDGQEQIIGSILSGKDSLAIMPTGGGKSLCYQLPALMLNGVTLVISPLISLMKDQVMALHDAGISAAYVNSSLNDVQMRSVYRNMMDGAYKIVYVAPERLEAEGFISLIKQLRPSFIAVDEAHCISQWGQDFRPSYLKIASFIQKLSPRPVVAAFTATATERVRTDIVDALQLSDPFRIVTGFDRPNLFFDVKKPQNKTEMLKELVSRRRNRAGIIYCSTRSKVDSVCASINEIGIAATRYHAGLSDAERHKNQDDFQFDRKTVMVATNAFGMGIDKSNIGFVIHYNMPKNLEAYYQEAGRAGRDGEKADCILLYSPGDIITAKYLIESSSENSKLSPEERQQIVKEDFRRLDDMVSYCKTPYCLRGYILDYFGQQHEEKCDFCGNCTSKYSTVNITIAAQMILSCVKRIRSFLGYSLGSAMVVSVLSGSKSKRIYELGLDGLSTYALMKDVPRPKIREYIDFLEAENYLYTNQIHGSIELGEKAASVIFGEAQVEISIKQAAPKPDTKSFDAQEASTPSQSAEAPPDLVEQLKSLRYRIAQEERVPAYIVFSNVTLIDMAAKKPRSVSEFLEVNGVGEAKAERYGSRFLQAIADFESK